MVDKAHLGHRNIIAPLEAVQCSREPKQFSSALKVSAVGSHQNIVFRLDRQALGGGGNGSAEGITQRLGDVGEVRRSLHTPGRVSLQGRAQRAWQTLWT